MKIPIKVEDFDKPVTKWSAVLCSHGARLIDCPTAECGEIRRLVATSSDDGLFVEKSTGRGTRNRSGGGVDQTTTILSRRSEIAPELKPSRKARRSWQRAELAGILTTVADIVALKRDRLINARQAEMLNKLCAAPMSRSWTQVCDDIGRHLKCSRRTVTRELSAAIRAACDRYYVSREQGTGWISTANGSWRVARHPREVWSRARSNGHSVAELVTDAAIQDRVLQRSRRTDHVLKPVPETPMRLLLTALLTTVADPIPSMELRGVNGKIVRVTSTNDLLPPDRRIVASADWEHNLKWAQYRCGRQRKVSVVYRALVRGCRLCGTCHTPILAGCRLDGRMIKRDRQYCGDACKQAHRRRTPR